MDRIREDLLPLAHVINERVQQVAEAMHVKGQSLTLLDMGEILAFIQEQIVCSDYLLPTTEAHTPWQNTFPDEIRGIAEKMIKVSVEQSEKGAQLEHLIVASVLVTMNLYMSRYLEPEDEQ